MSWDAWNAHVMACRGIGSGGIYSRAGAVCAEQGHNLTVDQIKAIETAGKSASSTSLMLADKKAMILKRDFVSEPYGDPDPLPGFNGRSGNQAISVIFTKTLFLVAVAAPDAASGNMAVDLEKVGKMLLGSGL